jgi:UPF0716 protein FxsA
MFGRLFLLFTLVPALELYLLVKIGGQIGTERTIAIIIITGVIGAYLARREGTRVWMEVQRKLSQGVMPGDELIGALLILIAGALLVTPGFLTDIAGFSLLIPPLRKQVVQILKKRFAGSINIAGGPMGGSKGGPMGGDGQGWGGTP